MTGSEMFYTRNEAFCVCFIRGISCKKNLCDKQNVLFYGTPRINYLPRPRPTSDRTATDRPWPRVKNTAGSFFLDMGTTSLFWKKSIKSIGSESYRVVEIPKSSNQLHLIFRWVIFAKMVWKYLYVNREIKRWQNEILKGRFLIKKVTVWMPMYSRPRSRPDGPFAGLFWSDLWG